MIGQTISHYKIVQKIGQGGMGEVYLAEDTSLDRQVALKFLPEDLQQDETARKRFLREAKSAAALDHPYICNIFEVGKDEGKDFIVMEYVEGQTLKNRIQKGSLPLKDTLRIVSEIAGALEKAHQKDIVHRDLKPSNIMLTGEGHVKVMDFGLAKRVEPDEVGSQEVTATGLTKTGMTMGTVPYMSPEQVRGQIVDTRSDIFSFGVILYQLLTGVNPFLREHHADTASAILSQDPSPLSDHIKAVPDLLEHMLRKMLAKPAEDRYQSVHELRTDLQGLSASVPAVVRIVSPRWLWATAAFMAVLLVLWMGWRVEQQPSGGLPERITSIAVLPLDKRDMIRTGPGKRSILLSDLKTIKIPRGLRLLHQHNLEMARQSISNARQL